MKWTRTDEGYASGEYAIRKIRERRTAKRGNKSVYETLYVVSFRGQEFTWAVETLAEAKSACVGHAARQ